jgi:hypothetical protein
MCIAHESDPNRCVQTARARAAVIRGDSYPLCTGSSLYRHCSEPIEPTAPVDRAACVRAREAVHTYEGARVREVWTSLKRTLRFTALSGRIGPVGEDAV